MILPHSAFKIDSLLAGMDVQLADLFEDIVYQSAADSLSDSRLFVIDTSGRALAHPLLQAPSAASSGGKWQLPPINQLETGGFGAALHHMISLPSGSYTTSRNVTYTWQHVRYGTQTF
jgi:hypothetical protein